MGYLSRRPNMSASREEVTELLWTDGNSEKTKSSFRQALRQLRQAEGVAGTNFVSAEQGEIFLKKEVFWSDVEEVNQCLQTGKEADFDQAKSLYQGEFMAGFENLTPKFAVWLIAERERITNSIHSLTWQHLYDAAPQQESRKIDSATLFLLHLDPADEAVHRYLIKNYLAQEQEELAIQQFKQCERELLNHLNRPPNSETIALMEGIEMPQSKAAYPELIVEYLFEKERPVTLDELRNHFSQFATPPADTTIRGRLSDLSRSKKIIRIKPGVYVHPKWHETLFDPIWDFFLSYNERNLAVAKRVSLALEESGFSVFSQFNDMTSGKSFVREMNRGLSGMSRMISLYSDSYFSSGPCQSEWEAAYLFDSSGEKGKIVPFLVEPCSPPPLARRLVWTSLLGLSPKQEREAVLNAVELPITPKDRKAQRSLLMEASSPDVLTDASGSKLDATNNKKFDEPFAEVDLHYLPEMLRTLIRTALVASRGKNCPAGFTAALEAYAHELDARGANCILGVLRGQMDFIEAEIDDPDSNYWISGAGLLATLQNIRDAHAKLLAHYPLDQNRERLLRSISLDSAKTTPEESYELRREILNATKEAYEEKLVTDAYRSVVENSDRLTRDVLDIKISAQVDSDDEGFSLREKDRLLRLEDAKKRALTQQVGFADKSLEVISKMTKIADSPSTQRLAKALKEMADWFW